MSAYKLIEELGLEIRTLSLHAREGEGYRAHWVAGVVSARDLEALLATAEIQYHRTSCQISFAGAPDTKAFLLGERPIVKDSAESLLKELSTYEDFQHTNGKPSLYELIERARKLLASHREDGE